MIAMSVYSKVYWYYLDSDEYSGNKDLFFLLFDHRGICGKESTRFSFSSEIHRNNAERVKSCEASFCQRLTTSKFKYYFNKLWDSNQLFATVFAYEIGLTDKQISQISDLRHRKNAWEMLNYFLCNPSEERYDPSWKQHSLAYYVKIDGNWEKAVMAEDNYIRLLQTDELMEILP